VDTAAIDIRDLWFSYNGQPVLRDVTLSVTPGELVCMIGPNGSGKTTLLKLMLGLLRPDKGTVRILGQSPTDARPMVGYTPQYTAFDANFPACVMDIVLMGRLGRTRMLGPSGKADRAAAVEAMNEVDLYHLRHRWLGELSAGQRQRVMIARSLVAQPKLLLFDEPTASLDAGVQNEFYQMLENLTRRMTLVVVSHDVAFVSERVGKVVCVTGTVAVHPTADLTGDMMRDLYGQDIRLVRHDHDCRREHREKGTE